MPWTHPPPSKLPPLPIPLLHHSKSCSIKRSKCSLNWWESNKCWAEWVLEGCVSSGAGCWVKGGLATRNLHILNNLRAALETEGERGSRGRGKRRQGQLQFICNLFEIYIKDTHSETHRQGHTQETHTHMQTGTHHYTCRHTLIQWVSRTLILLATPTVAP